jgi:hypothetical protein
MVKLQHPIEWVDVLVEVVIDRRPRWADAGLLIIARQRVGCDCRLKRTPKQQTTQNGTNSSPHGDHWAAQARSRTRASMASDRQAFQIHFVLMNDRSCPLEVERSTNRSVSTDTISSVSTFAASDSGRELSWYVHVSRPPLHSHVPPKTQNGVPFAFTVP